MEEAIADYDTALNIQPNFVDVYNNRGIAKAKLKRLSEAIADFNIAIRIDPENPSGYYNRGLANKLLSRYEEGKKDLLTALDLAQHNVDFRSKIEDVLSEFRW